MIQYKLTEWATYLTGDHYTAPELRRLCLRGDRGDKKVVTSAIVEKLGPRLFRTHTGSVYELVGDPDPEFVTYCNGIGKPLNLDDPIRMEVKQ